MKKILIFIDHFLPGYKAGGIAQSIINLSEYIKTDFDLNIITSNTDFGELKSYPDVRINEWTNHLNGVNIYYIPKRKLTIFKIRNILNDVKPDFVYLHSMYSLKFAILPLLVCRTTNKNLKLILAPNGMLNSGALKFKKTKKTDFSENFSAVWCAP